MNPTLTDAEMVTVLALLGWRNKELLRRRAAFLLFDASDPDVAEVLRADLKEIDENNALIAKLSH